MRFLIVSLILYIGLLSAIAQDKPKGMDHESLFMPGSSISRISMQYHVERDNLDETTTLIIKEDGIFNYRIDRTRTDDNTGRITRETTNVTGTLTKRDLEEIAQVYSNSKFETLPKRIEPSTAEPRNDFAVAIKIGEDTKVVYTKEGAFGKYEDQLKPFFRFLVDNPSRFR